MPPLLLSLPRYSHHRANHSFICSLEAHSWALPCHSHPSFAFILVFYTAILSQKTELCEAKRKTSSAQPPQCSTGSAQHVVRMWRWIAFTCPKCQVQGCSLAKRVHCFSWVYRNIGTSSIRTGYIFPDGSVANSYHSVSKLLPSSCYYPTASFLWFFHSFVISWGRFLTTHPTSCAPLPPALVHRPGVNSKNKVAFNM